MNRFLKRAFILPEFILCLLSNFTAVTLYNILITKSIDFQNFKTPKSNLHTIHQLRKTANN